MEPFIGQILMFGGNFAPRGWATCDGQLLPIQNNEALFSILGTTYGGDGRTSFGLPDLRGRVPVHTGSGPGLTPRRLGQRGGAEQLVLDVNNLPPHDHQARLQGTSSDAAATDPSGARLGVTAEGDAVYATGGEDVAMAPDAITMGHTGGGQPVDLMPPFQVVTYIIALEGIFPSRS